MGDPSPNHSQDQADDLRYRFLINRLQERVSIYRVERDSSGRVIDWIIEDGNAQALDALGMTLDEARGLRMSDVFGEEVLEPYLERCRELDGTREASEFETHFEHDQRYYASSVFFISDDLYVIVSEDITERKRYEAELYALQRELYNSQKLESLGRLAGGIAHDFNNILQPILGQLQLIQQHMNPSPELRTELAVIERAAMRARELTHQILAFSRQDIVEPGVAQLQPMIREALGMMRAVLPAHIKVVEDIHADTPAANVTQVGIHRVIINLLTNSLQALGEARGQITVRLRPLREPPDWLVAQEPSAWIELTISDDGPGIPEAHHEHIFDPFFSTKSDSHGTGLGLAVVHGTVTGFGGAIRFTSEKGRGTSFEILLPAAAHPLPQPEPNPPPPPKPQTRKLMIVDDERMIASVMSRQLKRLGYDVSAFSDPVAALDAFRDAPASFDLIISDMTMPTMSGMELARAINATGLQTPVIICSGFHDAHRPSELERAGIKKVMVKPILIADLNAAIEGVIDQT